MPKYYCDYCDTYLTHDSPSVRKTHCNGRKHKENVKFYYQKWMEEQAQSLIDATTAAFKAGKIPTGQFVQTMGKPPGGAMIPPPPNLQPGQRMMVGPPQMGMPPGMHMPGGMPMMGPPGPMPPNMMMGMRPPPNFPMMQMQMRPPQFAGMVPPNQLGQK